MYAIILCILDPFLYFTWIRGELVVKIARYAYAMCPESGYSVGAFRISREVNAAI